MRAHSRLAGLGFALVAGAWALSVTSPGVAGASPGTSQADRVEPGSIVKMSLSEAPSGLRSAIQSSLGAEARPAPAPKQQAELTASDAAEGDLFALSVAVSGSTAVVGAPSHNSLNGAAYVFVRSLGKWNEQAELTTAAQGNEFGWSVAVSGSTAVVGAPSHSPGHGAAYVFVRSGTKWSQQAKLTGSDGASGDKFGSSVAVSGSTAVVGALYQNSSTGAAYVFVRSGAKWSRQAELTASDGASGDEFGSSVAVSGTTAVVGAPFHSSVTGAAYVFVRSGAKWSQQAELTASDGAVRNDFGWSVAVSGSTAVVGAPFHNSATGAAYVFVRSGTTWSQQAELTGSTAAAGDEFSRSVAVSGSTAVVGAPIHNSATGAAYVFVRSGAKWSQQAKLTASDAALSNFFAWSVAVSGSTAVVGAPERNSSTGAAYVFRIGVR